MTDLTALLERVRAAKGPDRELDGIIEAAFATGVYGDVVPAKGGMVVYMSPAPHAPGQGRFEIAEKYTASLDAVVALAEKVLPGWRIHRMGEVGGHRLSGAKRGDWEVQLWQRRRGASGTGIVTAATLVLALLAAVIAAKIGDQHD